MGSLDKPSEGVGVAMFIMQKGGQVAGCVVRARIETKGALMLNKGAGAG
jgi:hypothetical protein